MPSLNLTSKLLSLSLALIAAAGLIRADELSDAFDQLKAAEAANDAAGIMEWGSKTSELARAELALGPPTEPAQQAYWEMREIYLVQTDVYTEYAMAVGTGRPGVTPEQVIALVDTLIAQKEDSEYLPLAVPAYLNASNTLGSIEGQKEAAERIVALLPENEDALMALAEIYRAQNQAPQAVDYSARVIAALDEKDMPEGYTAETWDAKVKQLRGRAHFISGLAACAAEDWGACDFHLRDAEVNLDGVGPEVNANIFFYLGWANYQIALESGDQERMEEAVAYSRRAAELDTPLREQAQQNADAIAGQMAR